MLRTVNHDVGGPIEAYLEERCTEDGLQHEVAASWPVPPGTDIVAAESCIASFKNPDRTEAIHDFTQNGEDRMLVLGVLGSGGVMVRAAGRTPAAAALALDRFRELAPRGENPDRELVPITFWTYSQHGARSIRRDLDASRWSAIEGNYHGGTRGEVAHMMGGDFSPGLGGQLILWNGDPGTGKTTALRALAREWRNWCEIHYVVDPDRFFGAHADYLMDVFMGGDKLMAVGEEPAESKWRLLVLEDCGEMLQTDARREVGQALSRLLNACDGLIGRGLRILVLVTTNEPVAQLHDAVSRPGRCAAHIEFERFTPIAARDWLDEHGGEENVELQTSRPTLADLFGAVEGFNRERDPQPVGFAR